MHLILMEHVHCRWHYLNLCKLTRVYVNTPAVIPSTPALPAELIPVISTLTSQHHPYCLPTFNFGKYPGNNDTLDHNTAAHQSLH